MSVYGDLPIFSEHHVQGVHWILCFFPRIFESVQPLPRQHSPAICCTKNDQPIGENVHSHCAESFEGLLQRCKRGNCEKTQFFLNTLYFNICVFMSVMPVSLLWVAIVGAFNKLHLDSNFARTPSRILLVKESKGRKIMMYVCIQNERTSSTNAISNELN